MGCAAIRKKKTKVLDSKSTVNFSLPFSIRSSDAKNRPSERKSNNVKCFFSEQLLIKSNENIELSYGALDTRVKTQAEIKKIKEVLRKHFLFSDITKSELVKLVKDFVLYKYEEDKFVFLQGNTGRYFYVVEQGAVEVTVNQEIKCFVNKAGCFGEIALLHDSYRTASVRTIELTYLWVLSRESFKQAIKSVASSKSSEIKNFIKAIPFFSCLTSKQRSKLLHIVSYQKFKPGQRILIEGDPGDTFYIINEGQASCSSKKNEVRKLGPGEYFGEQALLYSTQRTASVTALSKLTVLTLGAQDLLEVFGNKLQDVIYKNSQRIALEKNRVFKCLTEEQVESCIELMKVECYSENQVVFKKGETKGEFIHFVMRGKLVSMNSVYSVFDCIGDVELKIGLGVFDDDIIAYEETDIASISLFDLESSIGGEISEILSLNELILILKQVHLFRPLSTKKLKSLTSLLHLSEFKDQEKIFKQGDPGDSFFIVKEGKVDIIKDGTFLRTIESNDYFGERAILFNEARSASAISKADTKLWVLNKSDFLRIIDPAMQKHLSNRIMLQNDSISLNQLIFVKLIGQGTFGKVFLVKDSKEQFFYSLKAIDYWKISEYNMHQNLIQEREILLQLDHPMLMKLVKTLKDPEHIYFLCEYVRGRDLFEVIRKLPLVDESIAKFYVSSCLIVLKYLHGKRIVHRDIKPENVMVDEDGYIKLIDFGTVKQIKDRTLSIIGTPHYMAPEVISGNGYSTEVDLWSLGAMLYEFMYYTVPFADDEMDSFKIYKRILEEPLKLPKKNVSCRGLLKKLLSKNPVKRPSAEIIMKDQWFAGVEWEELEEKRVKVPFLPEVFKEIESGGEEVFIQQAIFEKFDSDRKEVEYVMPKGWEKDF